MSACLNQLSREPFDRTLRKPGRSWRSAFLSSAAATALAVALLGGSEEAYALCPSGVPTDVTAGVTGALSVTGTPLQISGTGVVDVNGAIASTVDGCAINVISVGSAINIGAFLVSTLSPTDPTIVIQDAASGNTLTLAGTTVTAVLGVAIQDGTGSNILNIEAGTTVGGNIALGAGADTLSISASTVLDVDLGAGNDALFLNTDVVAFGLLDGGSETDTLNLVGVGAASLTLGAGLVDNFEALVKADAGAWALDGTGSFETLLVNAGTLTVNAGAVLDVTAAASVIVNAGAHVVLGTQNTTGTTVVLGGSLQVNGAGIYNATGATSVDLAGLIQVNGATASYIATGAVTVQGATGRILVSAGLFSALSTTSILGSGTIEVAGATAEYRAAGAVSVDAAGVISLSAGAFNALSTTTLLNGQINVSGGIYTATGATAVLGGSLSVLGGTYQANGTVLVNGGLLTVSGGLFNAALTTTVTSSSLVLNGTGIYTATGATLVNGGLLQVDAGAAFNANGTTTVSLGQLLVNGGIYAAADATLVDGTGLLHVTLGAYNALTTTLVAGGELRVLGGTYTATGTTTVTAGLLSVVGGNYVANAVTNVQATGILRVTAGTFTANAATVVDGGQLDIAAGIYLAGAEITVNGGIVLGGGQILGGQVLNNVGGTVAPGATVGTLFLTGTYTQGAGGNFQAEIGAGGPSDLLAVTGSATLAGNVEIVTLGGGFTSGEQFRIISTTATITTIFDTGTLVGPGSGDVVVWIGRVDDGGTPDETGNNVDVIIAPSFGTQSGLTSNQQAVADYLGGGFPGGTVLIEDDVLFDLIQVIGAGPNALDQIGGEVYDSFTAFSFDIARQYGQLVDQRVRSLRCAAARGRSAPFCGPGRTLLAGGGGSNIVTSDTLAAARRGKGQRADAGPGLAPGAAGTVSPRGFSPNTHPYGWSVWASAIGSYLSKDRTSSNLGYSGWTGGGVFGVDLALRQRWIVGVMAGGTRSNIDFSGVSGDGDLEAMTVGLYTAWYGSRWFVDAAFTYTKTWVEADRDLTFTTPSSTANGKTEGDQYAAHATLGYGFKLGPVSLEATGGINWIQLRQKAFTETGAGAFNLSVRSRTDDSLRLRVGLRAAMAWKVRPNLILSPSVNVGYAREILDNTRGITSSLAGFGGSFTVTGDEGSRNILTYGSSFQAEFSQGITLFVAHSGEWAGDRSSHAFRGGIRIRW